MKTKLAWALQLAFVAVGFSGCIIEDGNGACDENQEFLNGFCVCTPGTVPAASGVGCKACGDNQVVSNGECVCADGFTRTPTDTCIEAPEGLGEPCDPSASACPDEFSLCHTGPDGESFCTLECESNTDCEEGFGCTHSGETRVCTAAPTGLFTACESDEDCAGLEADYCSIDGFCLEKDCEANVACWGEQVCCDYRSFEVPTVCVPPDALENGACPFDVPQIPFEGGGQ